MDETGDLVWAAELDNGKYQVEVRRTGTDGYGGVLTAKRTDDGKMMLSQDVRLSYGAKFGPDISDVGDWMDIVERALPQ